MIQILIVAALSIAGYYISTLVPEELPIGKPWFIVFSALISCALFAFIPWWAALMVLGALLFGSYPSILAAVLLSAYPSVHVVQLACILALLASSRWRAEGRALQPLLITTAIAAILALLPQMI